MDASLLEELIAQNKPFKIQTASGRFFEVPYRDLRCLPSDTKGTKADWPTKHTKGTKDLMVFVGGFFSR